MEARIRGLRIAVGDLLLGDGLSQLEGQLLELGLLYLVEGILGVLLEESSWKGEE